MTTGRLALSIKRGAQEKNMWLPGGGTILLSGMASSSQNKMRIKYARQHCDHNCSSTLVLTEPYLV